MQPFFNFQYDFKSPRSTADLLVVVSERIARDFNRFRATQVGALDISKAFDRVWHAGILHKVKSYGISGQIFGLISSFLSNSSILGPALFLLYMKDLLDNVICNSDIYADDATLYSNCDHVSNLWQQLELTSEPESDLQDTGLGQEVAC